MRQGIHQLKDVQEILKKVYEQTSNGEGITRENMLEYKKMIDPETMRQI